MKIVSYFSLFALLFSLVSLYGAEASAESVRYETIDEAIARGDLADVERHIKANPVSIQKGKHPKLTPLHQALLRKRTEIAVALIKAGADVDKPDGSQRTPLHLSVERDLPEVVAVLLEHEAKPNTWDSAGWTPLHNAGARNRLAVAVALVLGGADVNALSRLGGTPLHEAAASGGPEIVKLFIESDVDKSVKSKSDETAYDIAVRFENTSVIPLLKNP